MASPNDLWAVISNIFPNSPYFTVVVDGAGPVSVERVTPIKLLSRRY